MKHTTVVAGLCILMLGLLCSGGQAQQLHLQAGSFDPLTETSHMDAQAGGYAIPDDNSYYIVQCTGPIQMDWKLVLEDSGVVLLEYLPDFAFLVRFEPGMKERVSSQPFVRWIGPYNPAYKIEPGLLNKSGGYEVSIRVFPGESGSALVTALGSLPSSDTEGVAGFRQVRAVASHDLVVKLAQQPGVAWIEERIEPSLLNNVARGFMGVPNAWANTGLYGESQIVAVCDTGLDTGNAATIHNDFTGRLLAAHARGRVGDWSDPHGHGTHVAGSVLGSGVLSGSNPAAHSYGSSFAGVAPEATLVFQSILDDEGGLGGLGDHLDPLFQEAYADGARIHTNSWGEMNSAGKYKIRSLEVDEFCWNHKDMTVLFAAGNDGTDQNYDGIVDLGSVSAPSTAKNCISVGASESVRSSGGLSGYTWGGAWGSDFPVSPVAGDFISSNSNGMAAFSSRGPTTDGRIKPDICAPGTDIVSCHSQVASSYGWGVYNSDYVFMGGTSMATPLTAGATALVRQFYMRDKEVANPSSALIKATLLNGATDMNPGQYGTGSTREMGQRPNYVEGWGRVNVAGSLATSPPFTLAFVDNKTGLATGGSATSVYTITNTSAPLHITLAWTDAPGSISAARALVNDLDLTVTGPGNTTFIGNGWIDRINNVEGVDIPFPQAGSYTVKVSAYNIPKGPQPYALVVLGGFPSTTIEGTIVNGAGEGLPDVKVAVGALETVTDSSGKYAIRVSPGTCTVTPSKARWIFTPTNQSVTVPEAGVTGVNFTAAAAPGGAEGTITLRQEQDLQSLHPYEDNADHTWVISAPSDAAYTRVHFSYIHTEADYDRVYVMDSADRIIDTFTGDLDDLESSWVPGSVVKIRLTSDSYTTDDGFVIDGYSYSKPGIPIIAQPGSKQALTDQYGHFSFTSMAAGSYTFTPSLSGWHFVPSHLTAQVEPAAIVKNINFVGSEPSSISGRITTSTIATIAHTTETPHPYAAGYSKEWVISGSAGAIRTRVHFAYIDTEQKYDCVRVLDSHGTEVASYSGQHKDIWSPWVEGSSLTISFSSDYSVNSAGFLSEAVQCESNLLGKSDVSVSITPSVLPAQMTAADGTYVFSGLAPGQYIIEPSVGSFAFDPVRRTVTVESGRSSSGVDFRAMSPGALSGVVRRTSIRTMAQLVESPHPYANNANLTYNVTAPSNAAQIRLHFSSLDLETNYDYVRVKDAQGNEVNSYTGDYTDTWSSWMDGHQAQIVLTSDLSKMGDGFVCDRYEYNITVGLLSGVTMTLNPGGRSATTGVDGAYSFSGLAEGTYSVTPSFSNCPFSPASKTAVVVSSQTTGGVDFSISASNISPSTVSVNPNSGTAPVGVWKTFTCTYADLDGATNLKKCRLLINSTVSNVGGVYLIYDRTLNTLYMNNNAGTQIGGKIRGVKGTIEAENAILDCGGTTVTLSGNNLTIAWKVRFKSTMEGKNCNLYMMASDVSSGSSGCIDKGDCSINAPPTVTSISPASGYAHTGVWTTFKCVYSDLNKATDLTKCRLIINSKIANAGGAYLIYDRTTNKFYMNNNAGTQVGGIVRGTAKTIQSENAILDCGGTTVTSSGNNLTISWKVQLKPSMTGKHCNLYMMASDVLGTSSACLDKGDCIINTPPVLTSVSPASGSAPPGLWKNFVCTYSDINGVTDLTKCRLLINSTIASAGGAYFTYDRTTNKLYMNNNAGKQIGGVVRGIATTIQSENAILHCSSTTLALSSNSLTIAWRVQFKPSMVGKNCNLYMMATDVSGASQTWTSKGTVKITAK